MIVKIRHVDRNDKPFQLLPFQDEFVKKIQQAIITLVLVNRQEGKTEINCRVIKDFMFKYSKNKNPRALISMQSYNSVKRIYFDRLEGLLKEVPEEIITFKKGSEQSGSCEIHMKRPWFGDTVSIYLASSSSEAVADKFRGEALDLVILDEFALYPSNVWHSVYRPMVMRTKGRAILTTTPNGPNHVLDMLELHQKYEKEGNTRYGLIHQTIHESKVFSRKEVEALREEYRRSDKLHIFQQEMEMDFFAALGGEYPFGSLLSKNKHTVVNMPVHEPAKHSVAVVCDIGSFGKHATFGLIKDPISGRLTAIYYEDKFSSLQDFLSKIYAKFQKYRQIFIIFPHDMSVKPYEGSDGRVDISNEFVATNRWSNVHILVGPKPKNKRQLWQSTFLEVPSIDFATAECRNGYEILRKFRFSKNTKTGQLEFGKVVNNGAQHAADAYAYVVADKKRILDIFRFDGYSEIHRSVLGGNKTTNYIKNAGNQTNYRK